MRRYTIAYAAWLTFVLSMATIALWWYRKVSGLTPTEIFTQMQDGDDLTHDPETATVDEWGGAG